MAAVIKDPERKVKLEIADFPLFPRLAILDPESTRTLPAAIAAATGHGRDDARDRGLRVDRLEPAPGRAARCTRCGMIRDNLRARGRARRAGRGGARQHADRRQPRDHDRARLGARDVAPVRRPVRRAARRGQRDPPAARGRATTPPAGPTSPTATATSPSIFDVDDAARSAPALAAYLTELIARLGPADAAVAGRRARGRHPGAGGGRDGRRHDAAEPARDGRGGLRRAVPRGALLEPCA